jgi:hypothetical protein
MKSKEEALDQIIDGLVSLYSVGEDPDSGVLAEKLKHAKLDLFNRLYYPSESLKDKISEYIFWYDEHADGVGAVITKDVPPGYVVINKSVQRILKRLDV